MPVMLDDMVPRNRKIRRAGKLGFTLWAMTMADCAHEGTDGLVDPFMLVDSYAGLAWQTPPVAKKSAATLVAEGLWHDSSTILDCSKCMAVLERLPARPGRLPDGSIEDGWFYFHDWDEWQLEAAGRKDGLRKQANLRRKNLTRGPGLRVRDQVRARDRDMCRYCGIPTRWPEGQGGDRKADDVGEIDHRDPMDFSSGPKGDGNSVENCVVSCKRCNVDKGQRTPEEWCEQDPENGRPLLTEPPKYRPAKPSSDQPRIRPVSNQIEPESTATEPSASRDARLGSGPGRDQVLAGSGSGSGQVGSGRNGHGPVVIDPEGF